jgi:glutathione synthase/RimK-type ligase-like ATP-grasp enzyme
MTTRVLFAWERAEPNSWNPVLADMLRDGGADVTTVHSLAEVRDLDLDRFDVCLPRFRDCSASMRRLDEELAASGIPLLNSQATRRACEDKAVSHHRFERAGLASPPAVVVDEEGSADELPHWDGETVVKPLRGSRSEGVEIFASPSAAMARARERGEDLLVQKMIWPGRSWRVIVGRNCGPVDPYWRRPPDPDSRIHAISTGSEIARDPVPPAVEQLAVEMCRAVDGDLVAADVQEQDGNAWALEINHNFDAHGGDGPAYEAFRQEIAALSRRRSDPAPANAPHG